MGITADTAERTTPQRYSYAIPPTCCERIVLSTGWTPVGDSLRGKSNTFGGAWSVDAAYRSRGGPRGHEAESGYGLWCGQTGRFSFVY